MARKTKAEQRAEAEAAEKAERAEFEASYPVRLLKLIGQFTGGEISGFGVVFDQSTEEFSFFYENGDEDIGSLPIDARELDGEWDILRIEEHYAGMLEEKRIAEARRKRRRELIDNMSQEDRDILGLQ